MGFTLITGASSGIGEEFARQLASKGHSLILVARSKDKLENLSKELTNTNGIDVHIITQDLSQPFAAEELYNKYQKLGVKINLLINNAGVGLIEKFEDHKIERIQEMLQLNVLTLTKLCYLFLKDLKQSHGIILNVASQAAFEPIPYMASYGATKAYVLNFTEALRVELKDQVKVMSLCPGPTYTRFFEKTHSSPKDINFMFRTTEDVVSTAITGMENGKAVVVPGWENKAWTFFTRFIPRSLLPVLSRNMVNKE